MTLMQRFSIPVLVPPRSAYFACLSLLTHLIQIISLLEVRSVHELFRLTCSLHSVHCSLHRVHCSLQQGPLLPTQGPLLPTQGPLLPTQCPLLPTQGPLLPTQGPLLPTQGPLLPTQGPLLPTQGPGSRVQRLHARTSVTSYTSVNIYNFISRLAHFNAL